MVPPPRSLSPARLRLSEGRFDVDTYGASPDGAGGIAGGGGIDRGQGRKAFRGKRSVVARPVRPALGVRGGSDRRGAGEGRNQQCVAKAHDALLEVPAAPTAGTTKLGR